MILFSICGFLIVSMLVGRWFFIEKEVSGFGCGGVGLLVVYGGDVRVGIGGVIDL